MLRQVGQLARPPLDDFPVNRLGHIFAENFQVVAEVELVFGVHIGESITHPHGCSAGVLTGDATSFVNRNGDGDIAATVRQVHLATQLTSPQQRKSPLGVVSGFTPQVSR